MHLATFIYISKYLKLKKHICFLFMDNSWMASTTSNRSLLEFLMFYCHSVRKSARIRLLLLCGDAQRRYASNGVRVRFAPSPTGFLHFGGLRTALFNYFFAKKRDGVFVLRIEDTDRRRIVNSSVQNLLSVLNYLKITPDEGPANGGPYGPYVQSERIPLYQAAAEQLIAERKAYRCFCSEQRISILRKEMARLHHRKNYDNFCRKLSVEEANQRMRNGEKFVVRFFQKSRSYSLNDLVYGKYTTNVSEEDGDPVIIKSDQYPTYHFANVVDDHMMQISHVLRGEEWLTSLSKHLQIYEAFNWEPPQFGHLPVMLDMDGSKLSKRDFSVHVDHFLASGYHPDALINFVCFAGGGFGDLKNADMLYSTKQLIRMFNLNMVQRRRTKLDVQWLKRFNREAIRRQSEDALLEQLLKLIDREIPAEHRIEYDDKYFRSVLRHFRPHIDSLSDLLLSENRYLWSWPNQVDSKLTITSNQWLLFLDQLINQLDALPEDHFMENAVALHLLNCAKHSQLQSKQAMQFLRHTLTGADKGLPIAEILVLFGKTYSLQRLRRIREQSTI
ncbi:putative glutamate--tRNA ligase, mitochondrial [Trichinella patagoniensis]|uniref:Nondiscriminating glutamyl-tRNA synthetase EARS2, mitochondrial n=1 Tax=Trichinella patagoniensis TaxID=990121 RepID=A0A0V1ADJ9_9BILA|nr:putative glutamate--tRNA ligase, mitochondrial [Trichinella patagoniensis]